MHYIFILLIIGLVGQVQQLLRDLPIIEHRIPSLTVEEMKIIEYVFNDSQNPKYVPSKISFEYVLICYVNTLIHFFCTCFSPTYREILVRNQLEHGSRDTLLTLRVEKWVDDQVSLQQSL